jgi:hypothetical protein
MTPLLQRVRRPRWRARAEALRSDDALIGFGDEDLFARLREQTAGGDVDAIVDELQLRLLLCRRALIALMLDVNELARGTGAVLEKAKAAAEMLDTDDLEAH